MGNELDDRANPLVASLQQRIEQLEQKLQQFEQGLDARISSAVDAGFNELNIQGQGCQANGGGKTWTIIVQVPTGGMVTGTFSCDSTPPVFNGTVSLS